MYLADPVVGSLGQINDLPGNWTVEASLENVNRGVTLELRSSFERLPDD